MAERKTKEFGEMQQSEVFKLDDVQNGNEEKIVMEIGGIAPKQSKKILLRKNNETPDISGNVIKDYFSKVNEWLINQSKIKVRDLATFFRLFAVMINSGLPVIKSLRTLANQAEKSPKLAKTLREIAEKVEGGKSLSIAMEEYPSIFSEAQIGMIKSGEAGGLLNKTMKDLAEELEKSASISGKVKGALVYPIMILGLLFVVVFLMMVLVVPQITTLYTSSGKELPLPTQIVIAVSNFLVGSWYLVILGVVGLIAGFTVWKKTPRGRYDWDKIKINIPVFGDLIRKAVLAKFAHSFGNLLSAGVPIIKSIEIVAKAVGNEVYKERFLLTSEDMKSGIPIAENLSSSKLFPPILVNMIEVGEQTAQLEGVTAKVGSFFDEEVENAVQALTKIMEPMILAVVGVVVGGIVAAVMLPIIQLTSVTGVG